MSTAVLNRTKENVISEEIYFQHTDREGGQGMLNDNSTVDFC